MFMLGGWLGELVFIAWLRGQVEDPCHGMEFGRIGLYSIAGWMGRRPMVMSWNLGEWPLQHGWMDG